MSKGLAISHEPAQLVQGSSRPCDVLLSSSALSRPADAIDQCFVYPLPYCREEDFLRVHERSIARVSTGKLLEHESSSCAQQMAQEADRSRAGSINPGMKPCSSDHRCALTSCPTCCWRYSLHVSRRILSHDPRRLHAVTIAPRLDGLGDFPGWRVAVRNLVDHRRRQDRWWLAVGLWCWLGRGGAVRGIVSLGAVTEPEFEHALGRRWPVALRWIEIAAAREEVYYACCPRVIADTGSRSGRYQPVSAWIGPERAALRAAQPLAAAACGGWVDAMPVVL